MITLAGELAGDFRDAKAQQAIGIIFAMGLPEVLPGGGLSMQVGIIGAGRIGATIARLLARAGHHINLSNSRGLTHSFI